MSWSISVTFKKEEALAKAAAQFDTSASYYAGTEEEKDVLAAKERALQVMGGIDLDQAGTDSQGNKLNALTLSAYGSRSSTSMTMSVSVGTAYLPDAPAT